MRVMIHEYYDLRRKKLNRKVNYKVLKTTLAGWVSAMAAISS